MSRARPGVRLGDRFRLERVIGTGGMASVWLGQDEQLDRPVAVKILSDALAEDERYVERFALEARTAAGVSHPNLVNIYDFDASGRRPYLVMEYIEGPTLGELIESDPGRLEPELIARELLQALRHIHDAGIVHRDVKPQNVLVGPDGRTRLTDFGIARPDEASGLTTTGQVLGTFQYLAPELRIGEPATVRSDLYATGVLLRETLPPGENPGLAALAERLSDPSPEARPESAAIALSEIDQTRVIPLKRSRATEPTPVEPPLPPVAPETDELPAAPPPMPEPAPPPPPRPPPEPEVPDETTVMPTGSTEALPSVEPRADAPPPPPRRRPAARRADRQAAAPADDQGAPDHAHAEADRGRRDRSVRGAGRRGRHRAGGRRAPRPTAARRQAGREEGGAPGRAPADLDPLDQI